MRALVGCVTIMVVLVLPTLQTGEAAGATCRSTKHDITLQFLYQFLEPPEKCLDVCVLCKPGSVLFQPCPDLSNPCIGNGKKVLIKSGKEFLFGDLESIVAAFPIRSQGGETGLGCYRRFRVWKIENDF